MILAAFAIGYSLPFTVILVGLRTGFGKMKALSERAGPGGEGRGGNAVAGGGLLHAGDAVAE